MYAAYAPVVYTHNARLQDDTQSWNLLLRKGGERKAEWRWSEEQQATCSPELPPAPSIRCCGPYGA
jgi:hypothetical protein